MKTPTHIFLFLSIPDFPRVVDAVFKIEDLSKAVSLFGKSGYHIFRCAKWDWGELPSFEQTEPFSIVKGANQ